MKQSFAFFAALLVAVSVHAQDWAKTKLENSSRHGEWVKVKHGERTVECFVVYPEVKEKATAVLVIHEIFGLSDWARCMADELAEAGYIAIAPDLLSGMGPGGGGTSAFASGEVGKGIMSLPPEQVTADLQAAMDYVKVLPACNGKVVTAGFCWGGGQTFRFATNNKEIKAACVFYGPAPGAKDAIEKIACPVYGFYAENDARIGATLDKTVEMMKEAGKTFEPVTYAGAGHGFMRGGEDPKGNAANKKAREDAFKRLKELLKGV